MANEPVSTPPTPAYIPQRSLNTRREQPQDQVNRFSGKLEQLQRRDNEQERPNSKTNDKEKRKGETNPEISGLLRQSLKEKVEERDAKNEGGLTQQFVTTLHRSDKAMATAPAAPPETPPAHLDKIAAAIAELSGKEVDVQFQLSLPMGNTHVESVMIGRDAMGRIAVQLTANAILPPETMTKMSAELSRRLREKKLRIGDIGFSTHTNNAEPVQQKQDRQA
jgi:hypothetical protein